jgi:hypothetical protein
VEENLRFTFDDAWSVTKLDEHAFFKKRLMPTQLTRAVDFLGLRKQSALYFIEVKDYRGSAIELKNDEKMCKGDTLFHEVARKSKDSVACVAGAARALARTISGRTVPTFSASRSPSSWWSSGWNSTWGDEDTRRNSTWVEQETRAFATTRAKSLKAALDLADERGARHQPDSPRRRGVAGRDR